jgi:hypothetical protein
VDFVGSEVFTATVMKIYVFWIEFQWTAEHPFSKLEELFKM